MERGEFLNQSLDKLVTFLTPALPFLNCNMNDFFTLNLWNTMLPDKLREDIEIAPDREALLTEHLKLAGTEPWTADDPTPVYLSEPLSFEELDLDELVLQIRQLSPLNMNVSVMVDDIHFPDMEDWETIKQNCGLGERKFDSLMSLKKEHEVKIMSQFVARFVKHINTERGKDITPAEHFEEGAASLDDEVSSLQLNGDGNGIKHLIDLGSGKGYLSCFLTLLYRFNVLAIDSSAENTQGAKKWTGNVHRIWKNLKKAMMERKHNVSATTMKCAVTGKPIFRKKLSNNGGQSSSSNSTSPAPTTSSSEPDPDYEPVLLKNLRLEVSDDINLDVSLRMNFSHETNGKIKGSKTTQKPIEYGLIGLHTCGPLGSDSIKLFLNAKNAKFLCNVPCCHHFLEENDYPDEDDEDMDESRFKRDFPLSKLLLDKRFNLGSKARMLASHSPHKMGRAVNSTDPDENEHWDVPQSVHYRCLLQVIILRKLGHTTLEHRLGRKIGLVAPDFIQYVRLALDKLCLADTIHMTDQEIEAVEDEHEHLREQFFCFYLLRSIFAPLLDTCIVLDRLVYLCEQESVTEAYMVQLFDPSISPRCQALVAIKK